MRLFVTEPAETPREATRGEAPHRPGFREVDLNGKFTDFRIGIPNLKQYQVDAVTNYAGIRYPKEMIIVHKIEQGTKYELKGHVGRKAAPKVIRARLNYGSLKLEED